MRIIFFILIPVLYSIPAHGQSLKTFWMKDSVRVTIDSPDKFYPRRPTLVVFYALPNGNTTEQTIGKRMKVGDDWHYDIQHIGAQSDFIRDKLGKTKNLVVIYLENNFRSWPSWKRAHKDFGVSIPAIVDSLTAIIPGKKKEICLNGHSGGGSFIFGYIAGVGTIPAAVKRISFLDSNYSYDSTYYPALKKWLLDVKGSALNVFAYNDSVALLNGKPFVSATGGTWHRSRMMMADLKEGFSLAQRPDDSLIVYKSPDERIQFFLKPNPDRKIFHTTQVELNGFIHSILCGTALDSKGYVYYGFRAYREFVRH